MAAEEIGQVPFGQPRKEVACDHREIDRSAQPRQLTTNIFVCCFKQARGPLPEYGSKGFRGPHLGHLSQISAPADAVHVGVYGIREAADQFHQTRFSDDGDATISIEYPISKGGLAPRALRRQWPAHLEVGFRPA